MLSETTASEFQVRKPGFKIRVKFLCHNIRGIHYAKYFFGGGEGGRVGGKIENEDAAVGNKKGGGEKVKYLNFASAWFIISRNMKNEGAGIKNLKREKYFIKNGVNGF